MSVNPISNNPSPTVDDKYNEAWEEYNALYTSLINNENYKDYFATNGELRALREALAEKLQELKNAIESVYDEAIIDALMKALGKLLVGTDSLLGLEARIDAYEKLVALKKEGKISDADYNYLLSQLNSGSPLNAAKFYELLNIAQQRKTVIDAEGNLPDKLDKTLAWIAGKYDEEGQKDFKNYVEKLTEEVLKVNEISLSAEIVRNGIRRTLKAGSLSMRVMQANNAFRDVESQLKADENLEDRSRSDENLKRLRDEGIWADTTSKRREEVLQEEALQKARNKDI